MKQVDGREIYTVSEINHLAKQMLEQMTFWIEGEISELKKHPSLSFYYLKLKDDKAVLPCISNGYIIENLGGNLVGQKILAYGNLSLYEPWGKYQFRIAGIEKAGEGLLQKQLEELIKKLRSEGLFDPKHKKAIPKYPKRVCIVTSEGSDAWNDFKKHTVDKFPIIE
ncbi:exodeoxyribonuclease VII large subunit, partial [Candidatus Curtissbacteria bacterium]|nr:exodeoxyribonuclease VII large subunit [Candidatus Curtissbacteria bacterium]